MSAVGVESECVSSSHCVSACCSASICCDPNLVVVGTLPGMFSRPLIFSWVVEDTLAELHELWGSAGCGKEVEGSSLNYACWAGDTWLLGLLARPS